MTYEEELHKEKEHEHPGISIVSSARKQKFRKRPNEGVDNSHQKDKESGVEKSSMRTHCGENEGAQLENYNA
ncbi:hypothetical protein H5410_002279 [Solanum commersonii]|uniref:Uncharacterized protein n=1 Tax=Solanum commersonii TaxID=4109 RepID=A0A9J6B1X1_SOLCO|nr:hypothetical protein H5410_002279 [Solanum commersonii]